MQDREIARGGKWDMTTVLSVTTPPIVWPKKRALAASGTIMKEQEWAVHIKQHNIPCGPTCMGPAKGEERARTEREEKEAGVKGVGGERGARRVTERERDGRRGRKLREKRSGGAALTVKHKRCFVGFKRSTPASVKGHHRPKKGSV